MQPAAQNGPTVLQADTEALGPTEVQDRLSTLYMVLVQDQQSGSYGSTGQMQSMGCIFDTPGLNYVHKIKHTCNGRAGF